MEEFPIQFNQHQARFRAGGIRSSMSDIVLIGNYWPAEVHYARHGWHHSLAEERVISAFRNRA